MMGRSESGQKRHRTAIQLVLITPKFPLTHRRGLVFFYVALSVGRQEYESRGPPASALTSHIYGTLASPFPVNFFGTDIQNETFRSETLEPSFDRFTLPRLFGQQPEV